MEEKWIGKDGWPCTFAESDFGSGLINAIQGLSGSENFRPDEIEMKARFFLSLHEGNVEYSGSNYLPASQQATDAELQKLHDLCEKLSDHISSMHEPALMALESVDCFVVSIGRELRKVKNGAISAFSLSEGVEIRGRRPDILSYETAKVAGSMYKEITGKRPTTTTDTATGQVSGNWPDFLSAIFGVFAIESSVAVWARRVSEEMNSLGRH